jgi:MscS family membrane protein
MAPLFNSTIAIKMIFNEWQDFLNQRILDNRVENILSFAGILLAGLLVKRLASVLLSRVLFRVIKREQTAAEIEKGNFQHFLELLKKPVELLVAVLFLYTAFSFLRFPREWNLAPSSIMGLRMILLRAYQIIVVVSITWIILRIVDYLGFRALQRASKNESRTDIQIIPFIREFAKILLVIFSFFFILGTVFRMDITGLIAGLGIGGLAVALAGKESLENLFASFTIFLDKPFIVGDLVQVGAIIGTVEKVGFRSTRIRTMEKTFLTLPNKLMVDQPLDNLTLRTFRRARYDIGLMYSTPPERMKAVIAELQTYLDEHPRTNQDGQVRFAEFGPSSLNIMVLYFVNTVDFMEFNKVREEINFQILDIVKRNGCSIAFPSTTVYFEDKQLAQPGAARTEMPEVDNKNGE